MHLRDRETLADLIIWAFGEQEYLSGVNFNAFRDLPGLSEPLVRPTSIDWLVVAYNPVVAAVLAYGTFSFAIPLAAQYWKSPDPVYFADVHVTRL